MGEKKTTGRASKGSGTKAFFAGFGIGSLIGGIISLLYAPQSGTETREKIKQKREEFGERISKLHTDAGEVIAKGSDLIKEGKDEN